MDQPAQFRDIRWWAQRGGCGCYSSVLLSLSDDTLQIQLHTRCRLFPGRLLYQSSLLPISPFSSCHFCWGNAVDVRNRNTESKKQTCSAVTGLRLVLFGRRCLEIPRTWMDKVLSNWSLSVPAWVGWKLVVEVFDCVPAVQQGGLSCISLTTLRLPTC